VITIHDAPKPISVAATAPVMAAVRLPASSAHSLRHSCVRRCRGTSYSSTGSPIRARLRRKARDGLAVALAGLRHPAATSARMASPAIQAVAVVSSLVDTQQLIVTEGEAAVRAPGRRNLIWAIPLAVIGLLGVLGVIAAAVVPSTLVATKRECAKRDAKGACTAQGSAEAVQFAIVPADAQPVAPRLKITGPPTYDSRGQVLFVTVRAPELSMLEWWVGRNNQAVDPKSYNDLYATETPQQQTTRGQVDMRTAKETAEYVALKKLGFGAELIGGDVVIDQLVCLKASADRQTCTQFAPSDKLLDPGDKLVKVDGVALKTVDDLQPILAKHKPGDKVQIDYERDGSPASGQVELIDSPDKPGRTLVGFIPSDTSRVVLPKDIKIKIDTESIGGPSAGLSFTVTLIDQLSKGDLLGGNKVAITGTIDINGNVGAIGGLTSKASAVLQSGAKYFLVPTSQGEADIANARGVVGSAVTIIPVATLDEALAALQRLGGAPAPTVQPVTTDSTP
jgi:Lon-like protease